MVYITKDDLVSTHRVFNYNQGFTVFKKLNMYIRVFCI